MIRNSQSALENKQPVLRPRVVLVGPSAARQKGGIAHFTSRLARELENGCSVKLISWTRLYPSFLMRRELAQPLQRSEDRAEYILDFMQPASWLKAAEEIERIEPELVIFTWSHPIHAPLYRSLVRFLRKRVRAELVLVCHNVLPHEKFPGAELLTRRCFKLFDRIIIHSAAEAAKLESIAPGVSRTRAFVPTFDFIGTPTNRRAPLRPRLLFFGAIRPYKGVDLLLAAMPQVRKSIPNVVLRIAGEDFYRRSAWSLLPRRRSPGLKELAERYGVADCVELEVRYIPDEELPGLFAESTLAVFPFRSASQSASLMLALANGLPVVATRVGGFPDVVEDGRNGVLVNAGDTDALASGIIRALSNPPEPGAVRASAAGFSWSRYAELLLGEHAR